MKPAYFKKAQELSRQAVFTGKASVWEQAMIILRRAMQS